MASLLQLRSVTEATRVQYSRTLDKFKDFAVEHHLPLDTAENVDKALVDYLDDCYLSGALSGSGELAVASWR